MIRRFAAAAAVLPAIQSHKLSPSNRVLQDGRMTTFVDKKTAICDPFNNGLTIGGRSNGVVTAISHKGGTRSQG